MNRNSFALILLVVATSCVHYHVTEGNSYWVDDPKVFRYNKSKYTDLDKGAIDTTMIYLLDSTNSQREAGQKKIYHFCRFFSGGQVIFISSEEMPSADIVNHKNTGTQGYYFVDNDKIRINMFQLLNGGQTGNYFGKIQENGDIMFYEQRPETFLFLTFKRLEIDGEKYGRKSFWKKLKIQGFENYKPVW
jgi:hypothetical protein